MTEQDIKQRNYSFCMALYPAAAGWRGGYREFLVGTSSKPEARRRALVYARARWGEPEEIWVSPRNYIQKARYLFREGQYDNPEVTL